MISIDIFSLYQPLEKMYPIGGSPVRVYAFMAREYSESNIPFPTF
jgi:hypothetical protein